MKVDILEYLVKNKTNLKKYRNIEKLEVIKKTEINETSNNVFRKRYICKNQNGREIVKSDFMLKFAYAQNKKGYYVPLVNTIVYACQTQTKLQFMSTEGEKFVLNPGDYVVLNKKRGMIYGVKKQEFEENYKTSYRAKKIIEMDERTIMF